MKTSTLLVLGAAAGVYYLYRKQSSSEAVASSPVTTPMKSPPFASPKMIPMPMSGSTPAAAADDLNQNGANATPPAVVIVQPDDNYDVYTPVWGWGPSSWGSFRGGGRGGHHGGGHGGHGGHH